MLLPEAAVPHWPCPGTQRALPGTQRALPGTQRALPGLNPFPAELPGVGEGVGRAGGAAEQRGLTRVVLRG